MTIAESLNPPVSPTASSAFKRARVLLESSFPMMGPLWVVRTGMFGSQGMAVQLYWLTSTGYGGFFALPVMSGIGSLLRLASSMQQPRPACFRVLKLFLLF